MIDVTEKEGSVSFGVKVVPRASKTGIAGEMDGVLRVRVASPPVDGAANGELVKFFAKLFGVSRSDVEIIAGHASRNKIVRIAGVTAERSRAAFRL